LGTIHYLPLKPPSLVINPTAVDALLQVAAQRAYTKNPKVCRDTLVNALQRIFVGCRNISLTSQDPHEVSLANGCMVEVQACVDRLEKPEL
jgi:hypothetical protein